MRLSRRFREIYLDLCIVINERVIDNMTARDVNTLISLFYVSEISLLP